MDLANTSAIVTGGASGLGAATAAAFAGQGATVIALDLPGSIENAAAVEGVTHVAADVTDEAQVRAAVDRATADPAIPLRAVVNCAGIAPSARIVGRKGVHDLALYRKVVEINLIGSFTVLRKIAIQRVTECRRLVGAVEDALGPLNEGDRVVES